MFTVDKWKRTKYNRSKHFECQVKMAVTLKRQISEEEKQTILERHGRKCFATGHDIPENEPVHFDHIRAFALGGESEIDNIAPMCQKHNLEKGMLPLEDFRIKLRQDEFFQRGQTLTLKDELEYLKEKGNISSFGESVYYKTIEEREIELEYCNCKKSFQLYICPVTGWKYFYAILPVDVLNSDDDAEGNIGLQPRYLIQDKVFDLYRHLQQNTVLHPSIARLFRSKILVFDGQHKIASLLWGARKDFELKIYIDPDPTKLNQTIIHAHDKFAQTKFYSSVLVAKLGSLFGKRFEEYKNKENGEPKTESGFVKFLIQNEQLTKGEVNKRFTSFLVDSVLSESENKISRLVSKVNRRTKECPLTLDMLNKSLFAHFLYHSPTDDDLANVKQYMRDKEISNVISLCNIFDEEILHKWDSTKTEQDTTQNQLTRMFSSKSMMAWSELLKGAVEGKLEIHDPDDRKQIFYRELSDDEKEKIRRIVRRLVDWSMWKSPPSSEIDKILSNNKKEVKNFLKDKGLTTGYLQGSSE